MSEELEVCRGTHSAADVVQQPMELDTSYADVQGVLCDTESLQSHVENIVWEISANYVLRRTGPDSTCGREIARLGNAAYTVQETIGLFVSTGIQK